MQLFLGRPSLAAVGEKQARQEKRLQRLQEAWRIPESYESFAFIAGYTDWGVPYGLTWEEIERMLDQISLDSITPPPSKTCCAFSTEQAWPIVEVKGVEEVPFDLEEFIRYIKDF